MRRREGEGADGLAERRRRESVLPPVVLDRPHHLAGVVARPYAPPLPPGRLEFRIAGGVGALPLVDLQDPAQHGSRVGRHVGAVPAVEGGRPGMRRDRVLSGDAEVGVVVLAARQRRIEAAGGFERRPVVHDGCMHADRVAGQQGAIRVRADRVVLLRSDRVSIRVDPPMPAVDHAGAGHPPVRREAAGDGVGAQEIVGIEKDDEARARLPQAGVPGGREAGVGLPYEPHTKVARGDRGWIVVRAVVDDDDLIERPRLHEGAAKRLVEEVCLVVCVHDERHTLVQGTVPSQLEPLRHAELDLRGEPPNSRPTWTLHS